MPGIYEALVRADQERFPDSLDAIEAPKDEPDHLADDILVVGAMLQRLEQRDESEISTSSNEGFEHFASLEVSIGALEDRLDDRERETQSSTSDLTALVGNLVAEIGQLSGRIDEELPRLRTDLVAAIEQIQPRQARTGLRGLWQRIIKRSKPAETRPNRARARLQSLPPLRQDEK